MQNPKVDLAINIVRQSEGSVDLMSKLIESMINCQTLTSNELIILNAIVRIQSIEDNQTGEIFKPDDFTIYDHETIQAMSIQYLDGSKAFTIAFHSEMLTRAVKSLTLEGHVDEKLLGLLPQLIIVGIQNQLKQDPEFNQYKIPVKINNLYEVLGNYEFVKFADCSELSKSYYAGLAYSIQPSQPLQ